MEKLRNLRKQRGYTQEYMSKIISTDVSNYSRKENDEVRIYDDEWEKLAAALDVPVEEIKEERPTNVINNNPIFHDNSGNFNQYHSIPDSIVANLQNYIKILEEKIEALKEENVRLKVK
ncbi:transcriptional regulator with XRE-family HTH domain [Chryseobacterium defluvii]|uniref:Transcriptional regulator with XRE-family HTH domain n=1 Tax=Chryseobacterium defluvii TaxID=160396 RepID=A0A840KB72_9FLAO|nr:helix-turn-helix transcriptional regulator [Chryseobacterium defluvii]MBB4805064.1 transcriptional regulator with XRE-family HTH domain [Chryseobacterium defluvii]